MSLAIPAPDPLEAPGHWRDRANAWLARLAAELAPEAAEWQALLAAPAPEVVDDTTRAAAVAALRVARDAKGALDDRRKAFTEPLHDVKTRIDALYRPLKTSAETLERSYRDEINRYDTEQENKRREAARLAAEAAAQAAAREVTERMGLAPAMTPTITIPAPPAELAGVTARRVWKFRITAPNAVPREYCSPDPEKIQAQGPGAAIPGVEWHEESQVRVTR